MGIISPYGTGPSPLYFGSGYIKSREFWILGLIFGAIYLGVFLLVGFPWILYRG
jgi:L-tartrate/succinate antiporter